MVEFTVHDESSAPEEAKPALQKVQKQTGFVPNLYGVLAEPSPVLCELRLLERMGAMSIRYDENTKAGAVSVGPRAPPRQRIPMARRHTADRIVRRNGWHGVTRARRARTTEPDPAAAQAAGTNGPN